MNDNVLSTSRLREIADEIEAAVTQMREAADLADPERHVGPSDPAIPTVRGHRGAEGA